MAAHPTVTCTLAASTVAAKYLHEGTVTLAGKLLVAQSVTVGDTFLLCKIPHGAFIVDGWVNMGLADGASEINIGLASDEDAIIGSVSASNTRHLFNTSTEMPVKVSVTDNARDQFDFLTVKIASASSSTSLSGTIVFSVQYTFDLPQT